MSVSDLDKIDAVGIDKITGEVILSILDDLDWESETDHIYYIENKIQAYLNFIEEDQLEDVYPAAEGKQICIKIYARYPLSPLGKEFIDELSVLIFDEGFRLIHQVT